MAKEKKGVRLDHISKIYEDPKTKKPFYAVKDVNLDMKPGEFVTLLGPSGCGKTTILRMIAGFESPDEGEIYIGGEAVNDLTPNKRDTAMVFQSYALLPHINVFDNVAYGLKLRKFPKDVIREKVLNILKLVEMDGMEARMTNQLSGGQQQRVALARALVLEPGVLLFDEPLSNLDAKLRVTMRTEIRKIQQKVGITAVYVTHDQSEAMAISDNIIIMSRGHMEQMGSPREVYYKPASKFVADFIGEANILNGIMIDDCRIRILGKELECVDKGFGKNTPVDVVIRPEDIIITPPDKGQLTGVVEKVTFKGVHYEMSIRCGRCEILVHSTRSAEVGTTVGMSVVPFNIQIMNKLLPFYDNIIETTVSYGSEEENCFEFELEKETIKVDGHLFPEGTRVRITLPPSALSLAGDGTGDLQDVYIESVIYKGEHNEIILESDERKWLMLSDTDEQVATYVPLSFDFTKAQFEVLDPEPQNGEGEK